MLYKGLDCVKKHARDLSAFGNHALIVTGRHSARACGALSDVTEVLTSENVKYTLFDKIEENPSVETILEAARIGIEAGVDFVIGIGGGSPCDAAKAIALAIKQGGSSLDMLYDKSLPADTLPVVAIPTTCGTGSEVTGVAVLTRHDRHTKQSIPYKIYPTLSFVDGRYLKAASEQMIKNTSVDALAHLIESYINASATEESRAFVDLGLKKWAMCKELLQAPAEISDVDRQLLMDVATIAGQAIAIAGTCLPHALSYPVTYNLNLPHGPACAMFLPGFLAHAAKAERDYILEALQISDMAEFTSLMRQLCPIVNITEDMKNTMVANLLADKARLAKCSYEVNEKVLKEIVGIE